MTRVALMVGLLVVAGCAGSGRHGETQTGVGETPNVSTLVDVDADGDISRLAPGTHVGIAGFSPPSAAVTDEWLQRWNEANDAASVGRILLDWVDVEPERGVYDTTELEEQLGAAIEHGQQPMVTIAAVDVSGTPFPSWLGFDLSDFDAKVAGEAYNAMVDHITPLLDEHDVWLLAVANEPPFDEGLDRRTFAEFVVAVGDHVRDRTPDLDVSFVFAGLDALSDEPGSDALRSAGSVLATNHYCLDSSLNAVPIDAVASEIDKYLDVASGRPVVFQEFGCPAAEEVGSSDDHQAAWFTAAFAAIEARPAVRAAFVFEFLDWSEELVDASYGDLIDAEPELADFFERFRGWLTTTGLFTADMTPRPAWQVYLDAARR